MGVMSGGELMASSLPFPASKIHPQIVCRASGKLIIIFRLPHISSLLLHERFPRAEPTHDGRGFHTLGVSWSAVAAPSDRRPGQHPSRTAGRNCAGNKAWSQRGHSLAPSLLFPAKVTPHKQPKINARKISLADWARRRPLDVVASFPDC